MICIIDCGTSWLEEIKNNVAELNYPFKVINLDKVKDNNFASFSGIIISGSPTLLVKDNIQEYKNLFKFIKTVNIPILGICFGHQIMGLLFGSAIHTSKKVNKKERIEFVKQDDLFINIKNQALFKEGHLQFITLPREFFLLAKSKTCANEAMKHKHKQLYGLQFHPEVSDDGDKIFRNFLNLCS